MQRARKEPGKRCLSVMSLSRILGLLCHTAVFGFASEPLRPCRIIGDVEFNVYDVGELSTYHPNKGSGRLVAIDMATSFASVNSSVAFFSACGGIAGRPQSQIDGARNCVVRLTLSGTGGSRSVQLHSLTPDEPFRVMLDSELCPSGGCTATVEVFDPDEQPILNGASFTIILAAASETILTDSGLSESRISNYGDALSANGEEHLKAEAAWPLELANAWAQGPPSRSITAEIAAAWCLGEGHGPIILSGWTSEDFLPESRRALKTSTPSELKYCASELVYILGKPRRTHAWKVVFDMLSTLRLDHIGREADLGEIIFNDAILSSFKHPRNQTNFTHAGKLASVFDADAPICFDPPAHTNEWVVPYNRAAAEHWLESLVSFNGMKSSVTPRRFLMFQPTTTAFYDRLKSYPPMVYDGAAVINLINCHLAHVAEVVFSLFASAWLAPSGRRHSSGHARILILPGVMHESCPWCVDLADVLARSMPGLLTIMHEAHFRGRFHRPLCFRSASLVLDYNRCSSSAIRGCPWFGSPTAADAFRSGILGGLGLSTTTSGSEQLPLVLVIDRFTGPRKLLDVHGLRVLLARNFHGVANVEVHYFERPVSEVDISDATALENVSFVDGRKQMSIYWDGDLALQSNHLCERIVPANQAESMCSFTAQRRLQAIKRAVFENATFSPTLLAQANAMSRAAVVIAVHGASLVNIVFMEKEGTLIEIYPQHDVASEDPGHVFDPYFYFHSLAEEARVRRVVLPGIPVQTATGRGLLDTPFVDCDAGTIASEVELAFAFRDSRRGRSEKQYNSE